MRLVTAGCAFAALGVAQREPGGIAITGIGGELGLESELRDERSGNASGFMLHETESLLREVAGLRLRGDIFHPEFFDFDLGTKVAFEQREVDGGSARPTLRSSDDSLTYDLNALLFKELAINGDVYAWRSRIETRQRFFATSRGDSEEWGGNLRLRELWVPTQLHYDQYRYEGRGLDTLREQRERMRVSGTRTGEWTAVDYSVEHNDVDQLSFGRSYRELLARGTVTQRFARQGVDFVRLGASSRDQSGDIQSDIDQAAAMLHLQWLDTLATEHGVNYEESQLGTGIAGRRQNVEYYSTIRHQLYESLNSAVTGHLYETELGIGRVDRQQLEADLRYLRRADFGSVGLSYRPVWYEQDEHNADVAAPVVGEIHVFTLGVPLFLVNIGVLNTSIVVSDAARAFVYAEPVDYIVSLQAGRTRLDIPVGSRIASGQTILVDYIFAAPRDKRFRSLSQDVRFTVNLQDWASVEFAYGDNHQRLLSGDDDGSLGDTRYRAVFGRLRQGGYELGADYEDWETPFAPYERTQLHASSTFEASSGTRLFLQALAYETRFDDQPGAERGKILRGTYDWQLSLPTRLYARAEYHDVDYRTDSGSGWLAETGIHYQVHRLDVMFDIRYTSEDFEIATDQDLLFARFSLRRTF